MPTGLLGKARYKPQAERAVIHSHGDAKDGNTMHYAGTDGISGNTNTMPNLRGGDNPQEFASDVYPQGKDFDWI